MRLRIRLKIVILNALIFTFFMDLQKTPAQKWIMLILVIIVLGGLIAFIMSKSPSGDEWSEMSPVTDEMDDADDQVLLEDEPTGADATVPADTSGSMPISDTTTATTTTQKTGYKDGTYSAEGNYVSPGGAEKIMVTLSVKDSVVTSTQVTVLAKNPASKNWQTKFSSGISAAVVGKKIDEIKLDTVAGSSLTPIGFMDALEKMKVQAQA